MAAGAGWASGRGELTDASLHVIEALMLGGAATTVVKGLVGRTRPHIAPDDSHDFQFGRGFAAAFRSFPSGHRTAACALASSLSGEIATRWPDAAPLTSPLLHVSAGLTAVSRMYHDQHWASDVVLGAVVGTLAGRTVMWVDHGSEDEETLTVRPALFPGVGGEPMMGLRVGF